MAHKFEPGVNRDVCLGCRQPKTDRFHDMPNRHTTSELRHMADELEALWREESLTESDPSKGVWSPDGLRELASMRDELASMRDRRLGNGR